MRTNIALTPRASTLKPVLPSFHHILNLSLSLQVLFLLPSDMPPASPLVSKKPQNTQVTAFALEILYYLLFTANHQAGLQLILVYLHPTFLNELKAASMVPPASPLSSQQPLGGGRKTGPRPHDEFHG